MTSAPQFKASSRRRAAGRSVVIRAASRFPEARTIKTPGSKSGMGHGTTRAIESSETSISRPFLSRTRVQFSSRSFADKERRNPK